MAEIKGSLNYVLQSVLAIGNKEPNMQYPPSVFSSHFNIVTSFLIDKAIAAYPKSMDVLRPFIVSEKKNTEKGYVLLPTEYRNMLGAPSISSLKDGSGECNEPISKNSFEAAQQKSGCNTVAVEMLPQNEWDERTQSTYAAPDYANPIGCFFGADKFKVCPYDIGKVEVRFVKKEKLYVYGYTMQPDDTYTFNPDTSVESEWGNAASEFLVKGCYALYGAYLRDESSMQYSSLLNQIGLF